MTRRSMLCALSALLLVLSCNSRGEGEAETIHIGYTPLIYAQPTFVAIEKGMFEEAGLKVEVVRFENSTQVVNALLSGNLDFCAISPVLTVFSAEAKAGVTGDSLFKLFDYNLDSEEHPISFMLVAPDSEIESIRDLKGKTVGVFPGNILSRTATKLLLRPYMDPDRDVVFQDVSPSLQAQALASKQIDAMFSLEPFATISLEKGLARVIHVAPQLSISSPLPGGAGFMRTGFINDHPEITRTFGEVIHRAVKEIRSDEAYAKAILPKYTPLSDELATKVRQPEYKSYQEMDGTLLQMEYDALVEHGILEEPMDVTRLIYRP